MNDLRESKQVKPSVYLSELEWRKLLKEFASSGSTIKSFCESKGVSKSAFSHNKKKIESKELSFLELERMKKVAYLDIKAKILSFCLSVELKRC